MNRLPFALVHQTLLNVLLRHAMDAERASRCAELFCRTTEDGVYTHGLNRFPRFVAMIHNGKVNVHATPARVAGFGAMERWNGNGGPGNLNAEAAMNRALELARAHGIGLVCLGNTNHWMRGGSYGWQAAAAGLIGICWTNTMANLTPWGGAEPVLGNNPLVLAVPRQAGHVVLDMALSQFSFGALEACRKRGEQLPVAGGWDEQGQLTCDPAAIERSGLAVPVGYWKGSGLALTLDMIATMLSLGRATHSINRDPLQETGLSQVFVAIHPAAMGDAAKADQLADEMIASLHATQPLRAGQRVRYPGEKTLQTRLENQLLGLPVENETWQQIQSCL